MNNNRQGPGFFNGFLWGLILGGGLVFLLGTKKGKKITRVISEGLDEISEVVELFEEEDFEGVKTSSEKNKPESTQNTVEENEPEVATEAQTRKFFKGIPSKKIN